MALDQQQYRRAQGGLLDVTAKDYYYKTLRPFLLEFNKNYHTDRELNRTIVEVMNHADTAASHEKYEDLLDSYSNMFKMITDKYYFVGPMKNGTEIEKTAVSELIQKLSDLTTILRYEKEPEVKNHEKKERLNYREPQLTPNGVIPGYNLDDTSNRGPKGPLKERIPTPIIGDKQKLAY